MPIEDDDDRAIFLDPAEFGCAVFWDGATDPIPGLFFNPTGQTADFDGAPGIVGSLPSLRVRESDLPDGAGDGDPVAIGGVAWTVRGPLRPDGTGMVTVHLEKAA